MTTKSTHLDQARHRRKGEKQSALASETKYRDVWKGLENVPKIKGKIWKGDGQSCDLIELIRPKIQHDAA